MKHVWMYAAVLAAVMTGCSEKDRDGMGGTREISVGARVMGTVESKAPVTTGDVFTAAIAAIENADNADGTQNVPVAAAWATPSWTNTITLWATAAAGTPVPLDITKVYPANGNRVYMRAWHPAIPATGGVVNFARTGTEDVMYGGQVDGNLTTAVGAFAFGHALTQLIFRVQATQGFLDNPANQDATGAVKSIASIEVLNGCYPAMLDVATGVITYTAVNTPVVTVPGLSAPFSLTTTLHQFGQPLMIAALNGLQILVHYSDATESDVITINEAGIAPPAALNAVAGSSHLITLTFKDAGEVVIEGSASVAPWQTGAAGNGNVES